MRVCEGEKERGKPGENGGRRGEDINTRKILKLWF